jgi:alanyl-tRNA synthetase
VRVEFVCGGRVVRTVGERGAALAAVAKTFGCSNEEVPEAAARLASLVADQRKELSILAAEHAALLAAQLHVQHPTGVIVARVPRGALGARSIALALISQGRTALVASVEGDRAFLCFGRPKGPGVAMNEILREAVQALSGKGGGSPDFAQGSGVADALDEVLAHAQKRASAS